MKVSALTACLCLCIFNLSFSQTSNCLFIEIDESVLTDLPDEPIRSITPNTYKTLQLDSDKLNLILESAPPEINNGLDVSEPFEILMSDGRINTFNICLLYTSPSPRDS